MDKIQIAKVFGFLALLIVMSYLSFDVPIGTGIPITGQSLAVLLIGYYCGLKEVILVFGVYFVLGGFGLPVFADGSAGWSKFLGQSGGYLYSFPFAALLISHYEYQNIRALSYTFQSFLLGTLLILLIGVLHLSIWIGLDDALTYGFRPFWVGGLIKVVLALMIIRLWPKMKLTS